MTGSIQQSLIDQLKPVISGERPGAYLMAAGFDVDPALKPYQQVDVLTPRRLVGRSAVALVHSDSPPNNQSDKGRAYDSATILSVKRIGRLR